MQNYGTIEYLVNDIIALLVKPAAIAHHLCKLPISKRLDILSDLTTSEAPSIASVATGFDEKTFNKMKDSFNNRNKIAHNPMVVKDEKRNGLSVITIGIHVIRHKVSGSSEEWVKIPDLEKIKVESNGWLRMTNGILGYYSRKSRSSP